MELHWQMLACLEGRYGFMIQGLQVHGCDANGLFFQAGDVKLAVAFPMVVVGGWYFLATGGINFLTDQPPRRIELVSMMTEIGDGRRRPQRQLQQNAPAYRQAKYVKQSIHANPHWPDQIIVPIVTSPMPPVPLTRKASTDE